MLISGRAARACLVEAGFSTRHARTALASQLAGPPITSATVHLYDAALVDDLVERRVVDGPGLLTACPHGYFVARRDLDPARPHDELVTQASGGWGELSAWTRVALSLWVRRHGGLPFLATVAGVVVLGAEIVGTGPGSGLTLGNAGDWFDGLQGARLSLGPGRPWVLHLDF